MENYETSRESDKIIQELNPCRCLRTAQRPVSGDDCHTGNHKSQHIRHRHGVKDAVQPEENRQQQCEAYAEHHFPDHGEQGGEQRFPK